MVLSRRAKNNRIMVKMTSLQAVQLSANRLRKRVVPRRRISC